MARRPPAANSLRGPSVAAGVNTAAKRLGMLDFDQPATSPALPAPAGAFTTDARFHLLWLYMQVPSAALGTPRRRLLLNGATASAITWPGGATQ